MHDCLTGLSEWRQQQQRLAEVDELHAKYAARDARIAIARQQEQAEWQAAYRAAVEADEEPPAQPIQPPPEPSRAAELAMLRMNLLEELRALMPRLRGQVIARAERREAELLAKARDTKVKDLEPIRQEVEDLATTLREVCSDGPTHRLDIDLGDVVIAATEASSCLWLPVDPPGIHREQSRVQVDRDPAPTRREVLHAVRRAESDRRTADMLGRGR
jgi:hypothetical protein